MSAHSDSKMNAHLFQHTFNRAGQNAENTNLTRAVLSSGQEERCGGLDHTCCEQSNRAVLCPAFR